MVAGGPGEPQKAPARRNEYISIKFWLFPAHHNLLFVYFLHGEGGMVVKIQSAIIIPFLNDCVQ